MKTQECNAHADDKPHPAGAVPSEVEARYQLIADQPFFKGMLEEQLRILASLALQVRFAENQLIFREGDPANRFYLILNGRVALEADDKNHRPVRFMTLGAGEDLGWSWLFPPYYLHFSAYALDSTEAIFFYGTRLKEECARNDALGYEIMKRVARVVIQRLEISQRNWLDAQIG